MEYKIIKSINKYSTKSSTDFYIYKKTLFGWTKSKHSHNFYNSYEDAEEDIIKWFSKGQGGIIEVDCNKYKLYPLCLPTP